MYENGDHVWHSMSKDLGYGLIVATTIKGIPPTASYEYYVAFQNGDSVWVPAEVLQEDKPSYLGDLMN